MNNKGLLGSGFSRMMHNKRYIVWFWLLNLTLAEFGTAAFRRNAHAILDHTLYAQSLVKGFDLGVFGELLFKPEFGSMNSMMYPALYFSFLFFLATALFMPGIFTGYAATYRLPREEFLKRWHENEAPHDKPDEIHQQLGIIFGPKEDHKPRLSQARWID